MNGRAKIIEITAENELHRRNLDFTWHFSIRSHHSIENTSVYELSMIEAKKKSTKTMLNIIQRQENSHFSSSIFHFCIESTKYNFLVSFFDDTYWSENEIVAFNENVLTNKKIGNRLHTRDTSYTIYLYLIIKY